MSEDPKENFADLLERFVIAVVRETNQKLGLFTGDVDKLRAEVEDGKAEILKALTQS